MINILCCNCKHFKSKPNYYGARWWCKPIGLFIYVYDQLQLGGCKYYKRIWWKFWIKK